MDACLVNVLGLDTLKAQKKSRGLDFMTKFVFV